MKFSGQSEKGNTARPLNGQFYVQFNDVRTASPLGVGANGRTLLKVAGRVQRPSDSPALNHSRSYDASKLPNKNQSRTKQAAAPKRLCSLVGVGTWARRNPPGCRQRR